MLFYFLKTFEELICSPVPDNMLNTKIFRKTSISYVHMQCVQLYEYLG